MRLIHDAGGVAVVAHPYWDVRSPTRSATWSRASCATSASTGSRPSTRRTRRPQTEHCLELCEEFDLVPTGSSDFHGPNHKTFSRWGAYDTYGLGEPQVPARP